MFLHAENSPLHILFNMYILFTYGPFVEQWLGKARFVTLYLLAGLAGSTASYTFSAVNTGSLGASGAIFGVVGALAVLAFYARGTAQGRSLLQGVMLFVGINLLLGFSLGGIDNNAHIGGLIGGVVIAFGLTQNPRQLRPAGVQVATVLGVAALLAGAIVNRTSEIKALFPGL